MIKLRRAFCLFLSLVSTMLLAGCHFVVFQPKGPIAGAEKELFLTALGLMLLIVVPVIILTLVIAFRYRASNTKAKYDPEFTHSAKLEAVWWGIPIIIIGILATLTWVTTHKLDPYRPLVSNQQPLKIQAISLEWRWLFIYPEQKIATLNFVEFPVNRPIAFEITSDAPMNSFQIQQLAGQIYAMAGMRTKIHLLADQTGDYYGRSVSFSGDGFSGMEFTARVVNADQFDAWVKSVKASKNGKLTMSAYNNLVPPSEDDSVSYFSNVEDDLFNNVMMKFMMPMNQQPALSHP